jgi:hypothetical protein
MLGLYCGECTGVTAMFGMVEVERDQQYWYASRLSQEASGGWRGGEVVQIRRNEGVRDLGKLVCRMLEASSTESNSGSGVTWPSHDSKNGHALIELEHGQIKIVPMKTVGPGGSRKGVADSVMVQPELENRFVRVSE